MTEWLGSATWATSDDERWRLAVRDRGAVIASEVRFVPVHSYWAARERLKGGLLPRWPQGEPGFWCRTGGVIRRE